ncbi:MAG: DNA repair protein RecN [Ruminococcaceae bacterium]|nr:DNA repair protein RecN [Oscillospiraceae bacterium]
MLSSLHIENIAIIEKIDASFDGGFLVLTGQTGAGKSILIDSIQMVLGQRASRDLIRSGEKSAYVGAVFTNVPESVNEMLRQLGIEPEQDGNLLIGRELFTDGKSTSKINGRPINLSALKAVGERLLVIHGQHDNYELLRPEAHIEFLDSFCKNENLIKEYKIIFDEAKSLRNKIAALQLNEQQKNIRIAELKKCLEELKLADISEGELENLRAERISLENSEKIVASAANSYALLYENEENASLMLSQCEGLLEDGAHYSSQIAELKQRLSSAAAEIKDIASELSVYLEDTGFSPQRLEAVEERIALINGLCRKYNTDDSGLIKLSSQASEELGNLESSEEHIDKLKKELALKKAELKKAAEEITKSRKIGAEKLKVLIQNELSALDMPKVTFDTRIQEAEKYLQNGVDVVEFLISANTGEEPKPIAKIASGGELSRIMLALKNVLNKADGADTLIFDEIDTGVSGKTAEKIGIKLKEVAKGRQVFCVTHLAQIAALADKHYLIEKKQDKIKTMTTLQQLDYNGRVNELARIIGGINVSDAAIAAAKEMIKQ